MATAKSKQPSQPADKVLAPQVLSRGEREAAKRARKLRRQTSVDEQKLWHQLRDKQLDGLRFRRQRPIGKYIVDFVCDEAKLIVELNDKLPDSNPVEKARAAFFKAQGYKVVHMLNSDVGASIKAGLEAIRKNLKAAVIVADVAQEPSVAIKAKKVTKSKIAKLESAFESTTDDAGGEPARKPAAKKPAAKKPAAKKTAAKKPIAKKVAESDE